MNAQKPLSSPEAWWMISREDVDRLEEMLDAVQYELDRLKTGGLETRLPTMIKSIKHVLNLSLNEALTPPDSWCPDDLHP